MKRFLVLLLVLLLVLAMAGTAGAANVMLQWAPVTEPDLDGYKIYQGTEPGVYGEPIPVGADMDGYTVMDLPDNVVLYFSVTAFDKGGNESDKSNEVSCINDLKPGSTIIININCGQ